MTTWTAFREAVRTAIVSAAGVADGAVVWDYRGASVADPLIVLTAISNIRIQPTREELSADGDDYTRALVEVRDVTVQVRVDSIAGDAVALADDLQLSLGLQGPRALLEAECTPVETDGKMFQLSYRANDGIIHARGFELACRILLEKADPTGFGTIGTVEVSGEVTPPTITIPEESISEDDS